MYQLRHILNDSSSTTIPRLDGTPTTHLNLKTFSTNTLYRSDFNSNFRSIDTLTALLRINNVFRGTNIFNKKVDFGTHGAFILPTMDTATVGSMYSDGTNVYFRNSSNVKKTLIGIDTTKIAYLAKNQTFTGIKRFTAMTWFDNGDIAIGGVGQTGQIDIYGGSFGYPTHLIGADVTAARNLYLPLITGTDTLATNAYARAAGGGGGTPSWSTVSGKPFSSLNSSEFTVAYGVLAINPSGITGIPALSANNTWTGSNSFQGGLSSTGGLSLGTGTVALGALTLYNSYNVYPTTFYPTNTAVRSIALPDASGTLVLASANNTWSGTNEFQTTLKYDADIVNPWQSATISGSNVLAASGKSSMVISTNSNSLETISGGVDGKEIILLNVTGTTIPIIDSGNLMNVPDGGNWNWPANTIIKFKYYAGTSKWFCIGHEAN